MTGGMLGALAGLIATPHRGLIVGLACAAVAVGAAVRPQPIWDLDRETDKQLLHLGPLRWAAWNGAQLGLGFTSRLGFWTWYLIPLGIVLAGDWRLGALIWGAYGLSRVGVAVVVAYASTTSEKLLTHSTALLRLRGRATALTRAATVAIAAAIAVVAFV